MVPRRVTILAFGVVMAVPALATFNALAWVVFGLGLVVLGALTVVDAYRLPLPGSFGAVRQVPRPLSLGEAERVVLEVGSPGAAGMLTRVSDHAPVALVPAPTVLSGRFDELGRAVLDYRVTSPRRGAYAFGGVDLRCRHPRGLWWRVSHVAIPERVAVYPNIVAVRRHELRMRRRLVALPGARRSRHRGGGSSLSSLRDYLPGDDVRRVNWTASARRDGPVTMEFEAERGQQLLILVDSGRLMTAPAGELSKLDHAVNAALLLAWVGQSQGDRVGLLTFSDRVLSYAAPRPGQAQVREMNETLYRLRGEYTEPDFGAAFSMVSARVGRRSLVVVLTDVLEKEAARELVGHAVRLARRHAVLVVALTDPELLAARDNPVGSAADAYRWAAAEDLLAARQESFEILHRGGVQGLEARAGELSPRVVERYLELRERVAV